MTGSSPEVWVFSPKGKGHSIRDAISLHCRDMRWRYVYRPTSRITLPTGRPIRRVTPEDATNLYRRIHTMRVGVWQVDDAKAPLRPYPTDNPRHYVPLHRFVQHKAFHYRIHTNGFREQWAESIVAFQSWIETVGCEGEADPRCLPFHVFGSDLQEYDLDTPDGRQRFELDHRRRNSRRDNRRLLWNRPPARQMHGQPILQVAGRDLIRGFHWDVSSSREIIVATTSEAWKVRQNGYINVSPNAHIRGSKKARRLYPSKKPA